MIDDYQFATDSSASEEFLRRMTEIPEVRLRRLQSLANDIGKRLVVGFTES